MRKRLLLTMVCLGLAAPAGARASGGPVFPLQGGSGVPSLDGKLAFVAVKQGRDTQIDRIDTKGWDIVSTATIRGRVGVPGVGFDGSATGLSGDGRTLVLAGNPGTHGTRFVVLDANALDGPPQDFTLPGYYTADAVSPEGRWLFLVHYLSPDRDVLRYEVRAYDLQEERMQPAPIVDPREPDEKMQGSAVTRASSPDGRWAYTLYSGEHNFVHALDTVARKAFCIDLDGVSDVSSTTLRLAGGLLHVGDVATIDTQTLKVGAGDAPPVATPTPTPARDGDGGALVWMLLIVPVALAGLVLEARRRQRVKSRA
jgi:hypothetical protein